MPGSITEMERLAHALRLAESDAEHSRTAVFLSDNKMRRHKEEADAAVSRAAAAQAAAEARGREERVHRITVEERLREAGGELQRLRMEVASLCAARDVREAARALAETGSQCRDERLEAALATASAELDRLRLESEAQSKRHAAKTEVLQSRLEAAEAARLGVSPAPPSPQLVSLLEAEQRRSRDLEAALALAALQIRKLESAPPGTHRPQSHDDSSAASAAVAAAQRERRLREERSRLKVAPDPFASSYVAAAEAIAAAEAAVAARREARALEAQRREQAEAAALRAAAAAAAEAFREGGARASSSFAAQEKAWATWLAHEAGPIRVKDVPWPHLEEEQKSAQPMPLTELRVLQQRWHPDRFMQRFGARIEPEERHALLARVTAVAADVNVLVALRSA